MSRDADDLPVEIARDADSLFASLRGAGWIVFEFSYDAAVMGNWYVDLRRDGCPLRIVRDRSQFFVSGPPTEELKAAGLWRAFDDFRQFYQSVVNWALSKPPV